MSAFENGVIDEQLARDRCCPFTFDIPMQIGADGCGLREAGPWLCITTNCMAWRRDWQPDEEQNAETAYRMSGKRLEPRGGYCIRLRGAQ